MNNRISQIETPVVGHEPRDSEPQRIGEILAELLAQYQARFPEVRIAVVATSVVAA